MKYDEKSKTIKRNSKKHNKIREQVKNVWSINNNYTLTLHKQA